MNKYRWRYFNFFCDDCFNLIEVLSDHEYKFRGGDKARCVDCGKVGSLVPDDVDRDSIYVVWDCDEVNDRYKHQGPLECELTEKIRIGVEFPKHVMPGEVDQ